MEIHHIVLQDGVPENWALAAEILAHATGMNRIETTKACRKGFGLIIYPLQREQAEAGAAALSAAGIGAKSIAAEQLAKAPPSVAVSLVEIRDGVMLGLPSNGDPWLQAPLDAIRIVYAGNLIPGKQKNESVALAELALKAGARTATVEASDAATSLAAGAMMLGGISGVGMLGAQALMQPADPRNAAPAPKTPRTPEPCIEMVSVAPLLRFHVAMRRYNYQTLGARRQINMRGNFKLVVNDIVAALPHAIAIGAVEEAVRGGNLEQEKFVRDDADVSLEMTGLLTRMAQFPEAKPRP